MDLRINALLINNTKAGKPLQKPSNTSLPFSQINHISIAPWHKSYLSSISFKGANPQMTPEEFLLPPGCIPDKYQIDAANALKEGRNTIVTAPTGTGKTAIAHYIIKKNFEEGKKTFYTTPLKALSNQKYHDLKKLFGKENVGILTGDRKENVHAPIVIMTTEIYRNMVSSNYFGKRNDMLKNVAAVVFDEFHYMGDPDRGSVWEESIMFTPENTQILALSATVGNNAAIKFWIDDIKQKPATLIDVPIECRHVPLKFIYAQSGEKLSEPENRNLNIKDLAAAYYQNKLYDKQQEILGNLAIAMKYKDNNKGRKNVIAVLKDRFGDKIVPYDEVSLFLQTAYNLNKEEADSYVSGLSFARKKSTASSVRATVSTPQSSKPEAKEVLKLIKTLEKDAKLPAIAFVFSKKYAEKLLKTAELWGKDLTSDYEKREIQRHIDEYKNKYGFYSNNINETALLKGYAIHSAAILPLQKQLIEELFNKKLLKVAFATETLAAGINMPARTVIMTDYRKPSGTTVISDGKVDFLRKLLPNEFHQMTGRAGRRGIDKIGYVVLMSNDNGTKAQFEALQKSNPNRINSTYKLDASSVTGFLANSSNDADMRRIIEQSFFVNSSIKEKQTEKVNEQMRLFSDYLKLLEKFDFVKKYENGYVTTSGGDLINDIKGKPQIPIIRAILDKKFENLSPADLAAVIAAIAVEDSMTTYPLQPFYEQKNDENAQSLTSINNLINEKLKKDLSFDTKELSASNTNDEILKKIEDKFKDKLSVDTTKAYEQRELVRKQIRQEEMQIERDRKYRINNNEHTLNNLKAQLKELNYILSVNKRVKNIKNLLNTRLGILLNASVANEETSKRKNEAYNNLVSIFNVYNDAGTRLMSAIPKIGLNPLAFNLINKWAKANQNSDDYKSNWDYICRLLSDNGAIKYEGDLFNAIAQTIDFIHQIEDVVMHAQNMKAFRNEADYLSDLKYKCKEAVRLLKQPPLYNSEEI